MELEICVCCNCAGQRSRDIFLSINSELSHHEALGNGPLFCKETFVVFRRDGMRVKVLAVPGTQSAVLP